MLSNYPPSPPSKFIAYSITTSQCIELAGYLTLAFERHFFFVLLQLAQSQLEALADHMQPHYLFQLAASLAFSLFQLAVANLQLLCLLASTTLNIHVLLSPSSICLLFSFPPPLLLLFQLLSHSVLCLLQTFIALLELLHLPLPATLFSLVHTSQLMLLIFKGFSVTFAHLTHPLSFLLVAYL